MAVYLTILDNTPIGAIFSVMLHELLSTALVTIIGAALYVIILTSLTWAGELRNSILNSNGPPHNNSARCRTCGTNFIDNCTVEDGKCQVCGRKLCSRCGLEWICPPCNKKRNEKGRKKSMEEQTREKLAVAKIMHLMKMKGYSTGYNKEMSIEPNSINNLLKSTYSNTYEAGKSVFPEYGIDPHNDLYQGSQNNEQASVIQKWEQNWLFKKKANTEVFKPLAMFLPSPIQNPKAKIGGVSIDDLSDLSDYSDSEINSILN